MKENKQKNPAAVELGKLGGRAQAQKLKERLDANKLREHMRKLVESRWGKNCDSAPRSGTASERKEAAD